MITIAIDSAMHSVGMALFKDGVLSETALTKVPTKYKRKDAVLKMARHITAQITAWITSKEYMHDPVQLVIEDHEYRHENERLNINTFANMYAVGVCVAALWDQFPTAFYTPKTWKGTVPKQVMTERIMRDERKIGCKEELLWDGQDDVIDAIGIGRYHINERKISK